MGAHAVARETVSGVEALTGVAQSEDEWLG